MNPGLSLSVSRESLALLELLVVLDTRDLVACLVSVEPLVLLVERERRYVRKIYDQDWQESISKINNMSSLNEVATAITLLLSRLGRGWTQRTRRQCWQRWFPCKFICPF